jgi:hypothetical protein
MEFEFCKGVREWPILKSEFNPVVKLQEIVVAIQEKRKRTASRSMRPFQYHAGPSH